MKKKSDAPTVTSWNVPHERLILTVALHRCLKHGIAVVRILVGDMLYGAGENPFVKMYEKMIA